jgi:SSS family solute:Na+ symporter
MPSQLATLDIVVVAVYVVGTTALGAWFSRQQKDTRTYFVGDRNVGWGLVLVSIVATETSTVTFLSVPGLAYREGGNLAFLQLAFGYVLGRCVIAALLLPQYMRGELFSAYQLLRERFSPAVQQTASALFLVTRTLADGLRLYLTALLLGQFTGWDVTVSILVMGGITLLYTYLGGMQAVIWTDLLQFAVYTLGALVAAWYILDVIPNGLQGYIEFGQGARRFQVFDFSGDLSQPFTFWAGIFGGAVVTMASHGADQLMVQRYLCSRSLGEARLALVASGFVVLAQFALFLLIGVGLLAVSRLGILEVPAGTKNDEVFGIFIVRMLPAGIVGLVIAAVLAAAMSTLSSSLNSSANAFVSDFYRPLTRAKTESRYLTVAKLMTSVWGAAQIGVALIAHAIGSRESVINQVMSVAGFATGLVLGLFLLGSLRRRVRTEAAIAGLVIGFAAVLMVFLPSAVPAVADVWYRMTGISHLAWPWYAPVGCGVTVVAALLVSALLGHSNGQSANRGPQPGLDAP